MRVKLSEPYKSVSGRSGNLVNFSANGNPVIRSFVKPKETRTIYQTSMRDFFSASSSAFNTLTNEQRLEWEIAAAEIQKQNELGQQYSPDAKALFVSVNTYRLLYGLSITATAPSTTIVNACSDLSTLQFDGTNWLLDTVRDDTPGYLLCELTQPLTSLQKKPREKDYILPCITMNLSMVLIDAPNTRWADNTSDMRIILDPAGGQRVGCRLTYLNSDFVKGESFTKIIATESIVPQTASISGYMTNAYAEWEAEGGFIIIRDQNTLETVQEIHPGESQSTFETMQLPAGTYRIELTTTDNYRGNPNIIGDLVLTPPDPIVNVELFLESN